MIPVGTATVRIRVARTGQYRAPGLALGLLGIDADAEHPCVGIAWYTEADGERGTVTLHLGEAAEIGGTRVALVEIDDAGRGSAMLEIGSADGDSE
jgi:hypothetical protein